MNKHITNAEQWLNTVQDEEQRKTLKWLIQKAKLVKGLDEEKEDYRKALHHIVYEEENGYSSQDILEKTINVAEKALKRHEGVYK